MSTILLLVSNKTDNSLLKALLSEQYTVVDECSSAQEFVSKDLCLIDSVSLSKLYQDIQSAKMANMPLYFPVILLTNRRDIGMSTINLWQVVDDIILMPIEKIELHARIKNLLRTRQLSVELKCVNDATLAEKNARLSLAIHASDVGLWDIDLRDGRLWLSNEFLTHLGLNQFSAPSNIEEMKKYVHPDELQIIRDEFVHLMTKNEEHYNAEIRIIGADKSYKYMQIDAKIMYDKGVGVRIMGSQIDVTERKKQELEREKLLELTRAMFNNHDAVMLLIDPNASTIIDVNPAAVKFYGYTREEFIQMPLQIINTSLPEEIRNNISLVLKQNRSQFTFTHQLKSGEKRLVDVYSCPINHMGETRLFSIIFDVTEREAYKNALHLEKEYLTNLIQYANTPIITWTPDFKIDKFNRAFERLVGRSKEEVQGKSVGLLFPVDKKDMLFDEIRHTQDNEFRDNDELTVIHSSGEKRILLWNSANIKDPNGKMIATIAQGTDITDRKRQEERLTYLSFHDHLTGIFNRRYFEAALLDVDNAAFYPLAVVIGDLNGLKQINDSYGYSTGDKAILKAAELISGGLRPGDIVARIGGDEFGILMMNAQQDQVEETTRNLQVLLSKERFGEITLSISFGVSIKTSTDQKMINILTEAEDALFKNKLYEGTSIRHDLVNVIMNALYEKSEREMNHSKRVSIISAAIASELGFSREKINKIRIAGLVHDIGKIGISEKILNKPDKLDEDEWVEMKGHSEAGWRILSSIDDFSEMAQFILCHHEKWDGTGYPRGLKGPDIPIEARIISLADAYDAMTKDRTYRIGMNKASATDEVKRNAGKQFDPSIVSVFLEKVLPSDYEL